jgi:molybdate transport system substrate-binding protein
VRALVAARVVVYAEPSRGGAAGVHIARVIEKLGLSDWMKPKTKFGGGGDVTEVTLAQGHGALGMTQISEIVGKSGAKFIGPFPADIQNYTGVAVGLPKNATPAAKSFVEFLRAPTVVAAIKAKGMEVE